MGIFCDIKKVFDKVVLVLQGGRPREASAHQLPTRLTPGARSERSDHACPWFEELFSSFIQLFSF